jgi:hypothetical protein
VFAARSENGRSLELVEFRCEIEASDTRAPRRFHPSWMYCRVHNRSDQPILVYGPRHSSETTATPTSLFLLASGTSTPTRWDCKGILIPSDRIATSGSAVIQGPVALNRDLRRVTIRVEDGQYRCPRNNGVLEHGQLDFAIPLSPYLELLRLPRHHVSV